MSYEGSDPILELYLREIGKVNLLTKEEEVELAAAYKSGNAEAREQMIKANLRLVVSIARDHEGLGLPLLDLINEGNIGLMTGIERFNPAKGGKISTYVAYWIKQSMRRALANQGKTVRLPVHIVAKIIRMRRIEMRLCELLGREPTDSELADELGISVKNMLRTKEMSCRPVCLDQPLGDEANSDTVGDVTPDESAVSAADECALTDQYKQILKLVESLSSREQEILRLRFGLDGNSPWTLDDIGEKFDRKGERIRQIEAEALMKLRTKLTGKKVRTRGRERYSLRAKPQKQFPLTGAIYRFLVDTTGPS